VSGERTLFAGPAGVLSYYTAGPDGPADGPPLLLVHSINAAAAAHEMRPVFERYRRTRRVYALDLPGYGFSDRNPGLYTPRTMTDAIHAMIEEIRAFHGEGPIDAMALSLSCEFLARSAAERPERLRSLVFIAPTAFNRHRALDGPPGSTRGKHRVYRTLTFPLWRRPLFEVLTSRPSVRFFLRKTWGSRDVDEGLVDYSWRTAQQPGADHAPFCFLSGFLFSADITRVYESLRLPVWMVHGVRGDFTDYRRKHTLENAPNWRIEVFQTGALPHFEQPADFSERYEAFRRSLVACRSAHDPADTEDDGPRPEPGNTG
jgi:pimeloyl-ACP methyl ester carboxylesterase